MSGDLFDVLDGAGENPAPFVVVRLAGPPVAKARPRFRIVRPRFKAQFVMVYPEPKSAQYEARFKAAAVKAMAGAGPLKCPVALRIFAMMPVPRSWPNKTRDAALAGVLHPTSKPDWDNLGKQVSDALNEVVYLDDAQVVRVLVVKEYGEYPGLIAEVFKL